MPTTTPRQFRLTEAELARLDELGRCWGPVEPLTRTKVLRILIERADPDLFSRLTKRKSSKKSSATP